MANDLELTSEDWAAARKILVDGNESWTDDEILRRLAQAGIKLAKIGADDHAYVAGLLRPSEQLA